MAQQGLWGRQTRSWNGGRAFLQAEKEERKDASVPSWTVLTRRSPRVSLYPRVNSPCPRARVVHRNRAQHCEPPPTKLPSIIAGAQLSVQSARPISPIRKISPFTSNHRAAFPTSPGTLAHVVVPWHAPGPRVPSATFHPESSSVPSYPPPFAHHPMSPPNRPDQSRRPLVRARCRKRRGLLKGCKTCARGSLSMRCARRAVYLRPPACIKDSAELSFLPPSAQCKEL